jgi:hypothetical protein
LRNPVRTKSGIDISSNPTKSRINSRAETSTDIPSSEATRAK